MHATSCARRTSTPTNAHACRDSNYRATCGAASLKVKTLQQGIAYQTSSNWGNNRVSVSTVQFPCGRVHDTNTSICHHGNCPWQVTSSQPIRKAQIHPVVNAAAGGLDSCLQVSLINSSRVELCGGVVLGGRSILTAARCLFLNSADDLRPSHFSIVTGTRTSIAPVWKLHPVLFKHSLNYGNKNNRRGGIRKIFLRDQI